MAAPPVFSAQIALLMPSLAALSAALHDPEFRRLLLDHAPDEALLGRLRTLEAPAP